MEKELIKWIDDRRFKAWHVSRDMIKNYALEICSKNEYDGD